MEAKDYITAIAGLVGVLIGGLITTVAKYLEFRHIWDTERRRIRLAKLELLFAQATAFGARMALELVKLPKLHFLEPEPTARIARFAEEATIDDPDLADIEVITNVFAEDLLPLYSNMLDAYRPFNKECLAYVSHGTLGESGAMHETFHELNDRLELFRKAILFEIKEETAE
jgi:hypothetical protein